MLMAKMANQQLVTASHQLTKEDKYYCPACQKGVHLKQGAVMRPHFAHFKAEACAAFSEGETAEHLEGKVQLREWLECLNIRVEMEAYLPELKQRPDLLVVTDERKVAIEFQCSGIAVEKVEERTRGYRQAGIEVVWVLGEQLAASKKLTAFQKACLTNVGGELLLFHYSVKKKRLDYWGDFQLTQKGRMQSQKKCLFKDSRLRFEKLEKPGKRQRVNMEIEYQKMMRQFYGEQLREFQAILYEKGETHISLPKEVYVRCSKEWMIPYHPLEWKMAFIWWLEEFGLRTVLTERKIREWAKQLAYHTMPQVTEEQQLRPVMEFIEILTEAGVLKRFRLDKWTLIEYPKRFKNLEEKLK